MTPRKRRRRTQNDRAVSLDQALNAVREGQVPYVNGSDQLGLIQVVDPHSEHSEIRTKIVNLRDDPVGQMHKRGQLGRGPEADARLKAARRWEVLYDQATIGGANGIDLTREYVDGGRFETPDTDKRLKAADTLARLRKTLGIVGDSVVTLVLGEKMTIVQVTERFGHSGQKAYRFYGARFRECLDLLALELGIVNKPIGRFRRFGVYGGLTIIT